MVIDVELRVNRSIGLLWFDFKGIYSWKDEYGRELKTSGSVIYANHGCEKLSESFTLGDYCQIQKEINELIDLVLSNYYTDEQLLNILPIMYELGGDMVLGIVGDLRDNYTPLSRITDDDLRNAILSGIKKCIVDYML